MSIPVAQGSSGPTDALLGSAALDSAERRASGCARPVRLRGAKQLVDTTTGEVRNLYSSADELDGHTYVKCGNRRASVCPTCSREYKGDAWHLLMCGLAGGNGVPESVTDRPCTFVTLTAPSFGAVHGLRDKGPCRARRDRPMYPHGRPLWCGKRHAEADSQVGQPLCWACYDYLGHVLWQWHAPELWRRFTIALQRDLAKRVGRKVTRFRKACRISYSKVVEFQARGLIHVHAPIRLDGPDGPDGEPCSLPLRTADLEDAVRYAAESVYLDTAPLSDGTSRRLRPRTSGSRGRCVLQLTPASSAPRRTSCGSSRPRRDLPARVRSTSACGSGSRPLGIEATPSPSPGATR